METQYQNFTKWINIGYDLASQNDISFLKEDRLDTYASGQKPDLTAEEITKLSELASLLSKDVDGIDIILEIREEINFNIANIPSQEAIVRYLKYLKVRTNDFLEYFKDVVYHKYLTYYTDKFYQTEPVKIRLVTPFYPGEPDPLDDDNLYTKQYDRNPITSYTLQLSYVVGVYEEILEYIDDQIVLINPDQKTNTELQTELTANTHKLLLFHKLGLLEPLYIKHQHHIGAVRFAELIGTLLGVQVDKHSSFRKSLGDFITETYLKPGNKQTVATPTAERKVNAYLSEIGLINTH